MSTYGSHPEQMTVKLTLGDGAHLVATSENGWAGPVSLVWGPDDGQWTEETSTLTDVGTVDGTEVSWTLTVAEVTARSAFPYVRLVDNGMTLQAGEVILWTGGLGSTTTQTIASLTAGPPGPTAVSADAGNLLKLGTDNLLMLDPDDLPAGGGDTTVQIGTVTLPESPTVGLSVSVLADSDTVLPEDVTWDSGGEPTITDRMLLVFVWSGDDWVGTYGPSIPDAPIPPDETGPTAGTLGVVVGVTSADGTVTGAADETELDAAPYSFRIDAGTWDDWQAGNTYEWTGLTAETEYDFQHRVRDAAGNITEGAVVTDTTDPVPADTVDPTPGTLAASAITSEGFTLTVTGASDDQALDPAPYAFSTDNGSSFSAWQSAATFDATGLTPETEYTCVHKVRDLAGNEATGASIPVETTAASGGAGLTITYISTAQSSGGLATYTFAGQDIGAADSTRTVIVTAYWRAGWTAPPNVTIGGTAATRDVHEVSASAQGVSIHRLAVPTGTTADVVVSGTGTSPRCAITVHAITGSAVGVDVTAAAEGSGAALSGTATDDVAIIAGSIAYADSAAPTWANLTQDLFFQVDPTGLGPLRGSSASASAGAGAISSSATWPSATAVESVLVAYKAAP